MQQIEQRLWEYIDGACSDAEKTEIELKLKAETEWKTKYEELLVVHSLLKGVELEEPSLRFTQDVMESIERLNISPAAKTYIDKKIIYGIGGFFGLLIFGLLIYAAGQIHWSAPGSGILNFDMGTNGLSKLLSSTYTKIFMMISIVLALMLLDKYYNNRKDRAKHTQS